MAPPLVIRLHPEDNVVIARATLLPGARSTTPWPPSVFRRATRSRPDQSRSATRSGVTARSSASRPPPLRPANTCTSIIAKWAISQRTMPMASTPSPTEFDSTPGDFQGIRRPDGRVATRNYIGILTSVNCSAHVAGVVADMFRRNPFTGDDPLADYPNVDGVVALTHKSGCGMTQDEPLRCSAGPWPATPAIRIFPTSSCWAWAAR